MNIHESLNLLGQAAERQIPALNFGGCCVFAAEVGKALKAKGIPVRGVVLGDSYDWERPVLDEVHARVENPEDYMEWENNGVIMEHVGLRVVLEDAEYNYDSQGLSKDLTRLRGYAEIYPGTLPLEDVIAVANNAGAWSPVFSRKSGIPAIKRLVREYLEE